MRACANSRLHLANSNPLKTGILVIQSKKLINDIIKKFKICAVKKFLEFLKLWFFHTCVQTGRSGSKIWYSYTLLTAQIFWFVSHLFNKLFSLLHHHSSFEENWVCKLQIFITRAQNVFFHKSKNLTERAKKRNDYLLLEEFQIKNLHIDFQPFKQALEKVDGNFNKEVVLSPKL